MAKTKSNIFCPNCGANNRIGQNFCRFCSFNLQETTSSLNAQLSTGQNAGQLKKLERIKKLSDLTSIGLTFTIAAGILIYTYTVLTQNAFSGGRIFLSLFILFLVLESVMFYFRRKNTLGYWEEMNRKNSLRQNDLKKSDTAKLLEDKPFEPVSSVTENSTEFLFAENKTKKME